MSAEKKGFTPKDVEQLQRHFEKARSALLITLWPTNDRTLPGDVPTERFQMTVQNVAGAIDFAYHEGQKSHDALVEAARLAQETNNRIRGGGEVKDIKCQACLPSDTSCRTCHGHKVLLVTGHCGKCKREIWIRPGAYTSFEGKRWVSFDGVTMVDHMSAASNCLQCET